MGGLLSVPCHGHEVGQPGQGRRQLGLARGLRRLHMTVHQHEHSPRMALASSCLARQNTTGAFYSCTTILECAWGGLGRFSGCSLNAIQGPIWHLASCAQCFLTLCSL